MPAYYPVYLDLQDKSAVVLGGGTVAERKVVSLLGSGARVTVISPVLTAELERMAQVGEIAVRRRSYAPGDMAGVYLAIVATDDNAVNRQAASEAQRERVLVNTVDDVAYCDFIAPAVVHQGDLTLAISTNGKSPAMARLVREELQAFLTSDYSDLLNVLEHVRGRLRRQNVRVSPDCWQEHIDDELKAMVRRGELRQAEEHLLADLVRAADPETDPVAKGA